MKKLRKNMVLPEPRELLLQLRDGWNVGGTLHDATLSEWHNARWPNGLATCSDWVTAIAGLDGKPAEGGIYRSSLAPLKPEQLLGLSIALFQALTKGTSNHVAKLASDPVTRWVFVCAAQLKWLTVEPAEGA